MKNGVYSNKKWMYSNTVNVPIWKQWKKAQRRNELFLCSMLDVCSRLVAEFVRYIYIYSMQYSLSYTFFPVSGIFYRMIFREQMSDRLTHTNALQIFFSPCYSYFRIHLCAFWCFSFVFLEYLYTFDLITSCSIFCSVIDLSTHSFFLFFAYNSHAQKF